MVCNGSVLKKTRTALLCKFYRSSKILKEELAHSTLYPNKMLEEGDPYAASDPETLAIRLVAERSLDRVSNEDVRVGSISVAVAEVLNEGLDKEEGDSSHVSKNVVLLHHHMLPRMRTHPALERIVVWLLKRRGPSLVGFTLTQAVLYRHPPSLPPFPFLRILFQIARAPSP